jgi:hypothetical protein
MVAGKSSHASRQARNERMSRPLLRALTPAAWVVLTLGAVAVYETYLRPAPPPAIQPTLAPTLTRAERTAAAETAVITRLTAREACGVALRQQHAEYIEQHPAEALDRYYTDPDVGGAFRSWLDRNHLEFQDVEAMPPKEQTAVLHRYADEVPFRIQLPEPDVCQAVRQP